MVVLVEMTQEELNKYLEHAIQGLADELMQANAWSAEQSLAAAEQSFDTALPGRIVGSPNQFLRTIVADQQKVGVLWYGLRGDREAFVWDLVIHPIWRNQGLAKSAMLAMEQELRTMQVTRITLNVFAHNSVAMRLYSTMGYRALAIRMAKELTSQDSQTQG
jgi:ribosomal protein S18 acetylase RimI-like enzyme